MPALRELILAKRGASQMRRELVPAPELTDEAVYVRAMTAAERDIWEARISSQKAKGGHAALRNVRAHAVVMCAVNADGLPIFSDADLEAVGELEAAPVDRLYSAIARLSGITHEEQERLEKNLMTPAAASPSDSGAS